MTQSLNTFVPYPNSILATSSAIASNSFNKQSLSNHPASRQANIHGNTCPIGSRL